VDTLSLDFGASKDFAVHKLWLGAGKWGLEYVANLSNLPPAGAMVFVGAPKIIGASGGPTRVLAVSTGASKRLSRNFDDCKTRGA
jgi:kynurenine formamidase